MGLWGGACEWPKAGPVFLLAEVLRHRPRETWTLPAHARGRGCCSPGIRKLISSPCHLWPFQGLCGITFSRGSPRGYRLLPLAAWCLVTSPWCWPLVLEQQSWILGTEAWGRPGDSLEVRGWGVFLSVDSGRSVGGHRFAALLHVGLVAR